MVQQWLAPNIQRLMHAWSPRSGPATWGTALSSLAVPVAAHPPPKSGTPRISSWTPWHDSRARRRPLAGSARHAPPTWALPWPAGKTPSTSISRARRCCLAESVRHALTTRRRASTQYTRASTSGRPATPDAHRAAPVSTARRRASACLCTFPHRCTRTCLHAARIRASCESVELQMGGDGCSVQLHADGDDVRVAKLHAWANRNMHGVLQTARRSSPVGMDGAVYLGMPWFINRCASSSSTSSRSLPLSMLPSELAAPDLSRSR